MKRRITIRGISTSAITRAKEAERNRLRERFNNDPAVLSRFIDYMLSSGWSEDSIDSVARQSVNFERPPMQVFLQGSGSVIDQVLLNQGTYTHFADTASDPNFAVRFKAETETILRRLTPGDCIMLDAAQRVHALYPRLHEESEHYWRVLWQAIYYSVYREPLTVGRTKPHEMLHDDPWLAAAASVEAYMQSPSAERVDLVRTFFDRNSLFYTGVVMQQQSVRQPMSEQYRQTHMFLSVDSEESLWLTASVLFCYAVDNYARDWTTYETTLTPWFSFTDPILSHWARTFPIPYQTCQIGQSHADQTPQYPS